MEIIRLPQIVIPGSDGKPIALEMTLPIKQNPDDRIPFVIFAHGFKGFKNWGPWYVAADRFAAAGFGFLRFNFSHNGTSPESPADFVDLEAFGNNNFSRELHDLDAILSWLSEEERVSELGVDLNRISLIGHSRGGSTVLLQSSWDERISRVITWAAVADLGRYLSEERAEQWRKNGVYYIPNARTGQEMPLYYQLHQDLADNAKALHVESAVRALRKPLLVVHGTADPAVAFAEAEDLIRWAEHAELLSVEDGDHVFGGRHPWEDSNSLPEDFARVVSASIEFLSRD